jgi:hypothetical protein
LQSNSIRELESRDSVFLIVGVGFPVPLHEVEGLGEVVGCILEEPDLT